MRLCRIPCMKTCKLEMLSQLRGRSQRQLFHELCETSSEVSSFSSRGCFIFPVRDAPCFAEAGSAFGLMKSSALVISTAYWQLIQNRAHWGLTLSTVDFCSPTVVFFSDAFIPTVVIFCEKNASFPCQTHRAACIPHVSCQKYILHCQHEIWHMSISLKELLNKYHNALQRWSVVFG